MIPLCLLPSYLISLDQKIDLIYSVLIFLHFFHLFYHLRKGFFSVLLFKDVTKFMQAHILIYFNGLFELLHVSLMWELNSEHAIASLRYNVSLISIVKYIVYNVLDFLCSFCMVFVTFVIYYIYCDFININYMSQCSLH